MEQCCKDCCNEGCKNNPELVSSKVDICKDMHEHPENWDDYEDNQVDCDFWDDRTWR